ncbi:nuclear transport factor 2 family protein [Kutzneria buriramensis]|uniref:SnoaL-like protein n=1 Tax=Kutzneria buriramensis TaxID=1045776 RepID=A0A3E0H0B7_9PSEU|nr:nuclear transport factor 2 family protein [Kutzneria buriramensis]REH36258.1 SnoaL-like protein [Kutzneria buriramensis]
MSADELAAAVPGPHPNVETLRAVYADLARIGEYTSADVVLHAAERGPADIRYVGRRAVVDKEKELIRLTGDTLVMDVDQIVADDHFGAVLGVLRAHRDGDTVAVPFCGLWRFRDGLIVEHWENAYELAGLTRFLAHGQRA